MEVVRLILYILAAVVASSFISRFIPKISTPLVQILLGALLAELPFFPEATLDPELFMVLFIAPLLYLEAHEVEKDSLLKTLKLSLSMAIGLVLLTMSVVGLALNALWPAVPLAAAFALGAALGPTDAVAVSSLSSEASLSEGQKSVLEGESLFNDASGVIGFQFSILAAVTGTFSLTQATGRFVVTFVGGIVFGLVAGFLANWLFTSIRSLGWETVTSRILMELFLPFLIYLGADQLGHVSGILAVVTAGLTVHFDRTGIGPNVARTNIVSTSVWSVLSFSLNGAVFILLGMQLPAAIKDSWNNSSVSNNLLMVEIVLISLLVIGLRFAWIAATLALERDQETKRCRPMTADRCRSAAVMTFGGPKGTITLALMFTIPYITQSGTAFPVRSELIFVAAGVIVVTLVLANFLLPVLAPKDDGGRAKAVTEIAIDVVRQTIAELSNRVTKENRRAVMLVIDSYTKRITRMKQHLGISDPQAFAQLQVDALRWEKEYVQQALNEAKAESRELHERQGDKADQGEYELKIEAAERMMDNIMNAIRHSSTKGVGGQVISHIRGRWYVFRHRGIMLIKRGNAKIRRTTPLVNENELYNATRDLQSKAIDYVINRLYREMKTGHYSAEDCSALLLDYRRTSAALKSRPGLPDSVEFINQLEEVKHESYAIELSVIQDLQESGKVNRAQARELRRNVYVMQVDADSGV
ncbi:sodium:proton antiporter [Bifidobacterium aemilianum]|uniref:Sodium:proton antiporter n=1 Tax=Bifidobacterium aemilianum TaxID=2493120 RepID=A0A366K7Q8_9BIFI|nr:sodium:proton antiporter [Bifidobacterium aemilianum]RBP97198.1 sodium:proton antiporter [Bifidobacterium aemilianum]